MSTASGAIFISYAREDSVAADRIAEALRSHGLEVWFDQNELRGGEAWDQKIRGQIRTCALLIPIMSANTQGRGEGYFRREWKLAAERTHDMAAGIPFLVPVVIDDTAEGTALVPEEFMRVQWTRLANGRTTPEFAAQVKRLLEAPRGAVPQKMEPHRPRPGERGEGAASPAKPVEGRRRAPVALWIGVGAAVVVGVAGVIFATARKPERVVVAGTRSPAVEKIAAAPLEKSVAVLPFENLSPEPDNAFVADGIHDEVLTAVQKVSALSKVINRTSVLQFADAKKRDLREIGAKLGVATVLEGTVRRMGNRVRVAVQLTDVQSSRQLWAESYEKELTDVFAIQSAIAREIAGALKATLTEGESATLGRQLTQNAEAYRLYLQARAMLRDVGTPRLGHRTKIEIAIGIYEQAAVADPNFALPHLELTKCHGWTYWFGFFNPTPENARRAEASAARVQALMPGTPEARLAAGLVEYLCRHNWSAALTELRAAQAGLPNSIDAINFEAFALRRLGRLAEAITVLERARAIDPQSSFGWDSLAESQLLARRYADVIRTADGMVAHGIVTDTTTALRACAQLALDRDVARYRRDLQPVRAGLVRGFLPELGWRGDLLARDFAAAEEFVAAADGFMAGPGGVVNSPAAQFRAMFAFASGDRGQAARYAAEAAKYYQDGRWIPRQQSTVAAELALDFAFMGDVAKARAELARSAELQRKLPDAFLDAVQHYLWALTHTVLGDRDAAFAELRACVGQMSTFGVMPTLADLDPTWNSLKDDPRFAEIMKAAKPL